jgi:hypothetical protein
MSTVLRRSPSELYTVMDHEEFLARLERDPLEEAPLAARPVAAAGRHPHAGRRTWLVLGSVVLGVASALAVSFAASATRPPRVPSDRTRNRARRSSVAADAGSGPVGAPIRSGAERPPRRSAPGPERRSTASALAVSSSQGEETQAGAIADRMVGASAEFSFER